MPLRNERPSTEFNTVGPFDNSRDYNTNDRVSHNGMSYVAPEPIPAGEGPPDPGTNKWIDDPGSEGIMGIIGRTGNHFARVYIRSAMMPVTPTGTWDGSTLTLQGGWVEDISSTTGTETLWASDGVLNNTALTATFQTPQEWRGPVGPEPTNTRLNTLLATAITAMDLQDTAGVEAIISSYLSTNEFQTLTNVQQLLNQAYLNVLRDLGAIEVEYSLDGIDYFDMLNTYNYVRIRLNNPDADWNIIELGGTGGGGLTVMDITTEYSIDGSTAWHETLAPADRFFRIRIGTGTPSAAFMLPRLLRHYVEDANVSHLSDRITLTIPGVSAYLTGMEVEFEVVGTPTPANPMLQINSLPFQRLLRYDGTEFRSTELRQDIKIVAVYNGTDFVSDFREKPSYHHVEPAGVVVSLNGNEYTLTDSDIISHGVTPRSLIGFEAKADNTGNMAVSVNGSTQLPLRLSDGSQVPSGAIQDDQFLLMAFVSTGWNIINVMPARSLRGQLLATCDIPVGTHGIDTIFAWTVESGISYVTADTLAADNVGNNVSTAGGALEVPLTRGNRLTQLGWYLEIVNNNTVVYEKFYAFNEYVRDIERSITTTDGLELSITYWEPFPPDLPEPLFVVAVKHIIGNDITVAAGNTYQVRLYLSEN